MLEAWLAAAAACPKPESHVCVRARPLAAISCLGQIELAVQFLRDAAPDGARAAETEKRLAFGPDADELELAHKPFFRLAGVRKAVGAAFDALAVKIHDARAGRRIEIGFAVFLGQRMLSL